MTLVEARTKLIDDIDDEVLDPTMFKKLIGLLIFLCQRRPYICFFVGIVSRFMRNPLKSHLLASKRVLK